MSDQKVLVTGATGFIGKYVVEEFCRRGNVVLGTTSHLSKQTKNTVHFPLEDKEKLNSIILEFQPNIVVHLAAITSVTHNNANEIYSVNVLGTENLLQAIAKTCPQNTNVILTSSAGIYGDQSSEYLSEDLSYNPRNHYSYSKVVMELMSRQFQDDMKLKIVRPFNIIGPGQSEHFFVPKIVKHFANRAPRIELGNLNSIRDYVNVKTCAEIIAAVAQPTCVLDGPLNICSGKGYTGHELLELLSELSNHKPKIEIDPQLVRKNEIWRAVGSTQRLNTIIGKPIATPDLKSILLDMYNTY